MVENGQLAPQVPGKLPTLDRGSGLGAAKDSAPKSSFEDFLKQAGSRDLDQLTRRSERTAPARRKDAALEHRERALENRNRTLEQQQRAEDRQRPLENRLNRRDESRERSGRIDAEETSRQHRAESGKEDDARLESTGLLSAMAVVVAEEARGGSPGGGSENAEDDNGGRGSRRRLWHIPGTTGGQGEGSTQQAGAVPQEGGLQFLQAVEGASAPGVTPRSGMELLTFQEMMDPDLHIDSGGEEIMEKLQQALESGNGEMLDEVGEIVLPQVVRSIAALARSDANEMRLQLRPPELGELELRIRTTDGVVRGEIVVGSSEVKQLLESQLDRLRAALAESGLELEGFDVSLSHDGRSGHPGEDSSQGTEFAAVEKLLGWDGKKSTPVEESMPSAVAPSTDDQGVEVDLVA